jgi:hypothetical protein
LTDAAVSILCLAGRHRRRHVITTALEKSSGATLEMLWRYEQYFIQATVGEAAS